MSLERQYRELEDLREKVRQWERKNSCRRSLERQSVWQEVLLSIPGHITSEPCLVRDLSNRGAGIQLNGLTLLPTEFSLSFDGFRTTSLVASSGDSETSSGWRSKTRTVIQPSWSQIRSLFCGSSTLRQLPAPRK